MNGWGLLPLPAALVFLIVAVGAARSRGEPRGRTALAGAALSGALLLAALSWILSGLLPQSGSTARVLADGALLLAAPTWIALAVRFGTAPGQSGGWALLVPGALLVDVGLLVSGALAPEATLLDLRHGHIPLLLQNTAARAAAGAFLLIGAVGVLRTQALWEVARAEEREELRRALAGLILAFLGFFLFAAQTLLYGAVSLKILAVLSLLYVPILLALLPVLGSRPTVSRTVSGGTRPFISSAVLMGLGAFLIALAAVGEFMSRFAPAGRVLWFQWGGSILIGAYGALWLIPGIRRRFRRWLQVPELGRHFRWEAAPLLSRTQPTGDGPALLLLSALFEEPQGRPAVSLWLRDPEGSLTPWSSSTKTVPRLSAQNPLLVALHRERGLLDFGRPPHRLSLVPAYVENLELIEQSGFRLFLALRSGDEPFGLLAVAPREPIRAAEDALLLDLYRGELSVLAWGAIAAWGAGPVAETDSFLYAQAAELLHEIAAGAARRTVAPRFGSRLAAAAEEVAQQLAARSRPRSGLSANNDPRLDLHRRSRTDEVHA